HTTVSRYLRFDGQGVRDATKEAISAAIDELGYRPNLAARAMRTRRTGRLAILLPAGQAAGAVRMLVGATEKAHAHGYQIEGVTLDGSARRGVKESTPSNMPDSASSSMRTASVSADPSRVTPSI
ncbi:LacI family transcriptional regulator, partial [Streptomyces sp. wa22]